MILGRPGQLFYLVKSLLVIGSVSFGGYMALIAMVRDKFVVRDKVISDEQLAEAITLASLLPGPLAVNVVAYIGYTLSGVLGAICSILAVLMPSYLMVLSLSVLYVEFNSAFNFNPFITGIIPVVIAIIFYMGITMWKKNCTSRFELLIAFLSFFILLIFESYLSILLIIIGSGSMGILFIRSDSRGEDNFQFRFVFKSTLVALLLIPVYFGINYVCSTSFEWQIFDTFAQASITLFGGGYIMVPVLKSLLVDQLTWITSEDFLFGISIGQVTPGPILISSAFFGYRVNGFSGSLLATVGMFLPASALMILASHFYNFVKTNRWLVSFMSGVRPAVVGLIIYSGVSLVFSTELFSRIEYLVLLVLVILFFLIRFQLNPLKAIVLGALIGYLVHLIFTYPLF